MFHLLHLIIRLISILYELKTPTFLLLAFLIHTTSPSIANQPNWLLSGTFLDSGNAHAMFVDENGDELLLELGDDIQGCDLVDVFRDFAKLRCHGKEYSMQLRSSVGDVLLQKEYEKSITNSEIIVLYKSEVEDYIKERQQLVSEISFLPVIENNKVVGFSLSKIKPDTKVASLGLHNGDVIKVVNGVPAMDPDFMQTVKALSYVQEATIEIDRNGKIIAYTYILE